MSLSQNAINRIFRIATGKSAKRNALTPLLGLVFLAITSLFVIIPVYLERILKIPYFLHPPVNYFISIPLFALGGLLIIWTNLIFINYKGSPVPINPPKRLVTTGPFAYSRNPMTTGLFLLMFGFGFHYGSVLSVLIFTPLYIWIHYIDLKKIEEPELEKRLGADYIEYKKKVPMFFPWKRQK